MDRMEMVITVNVEKLTDKGNRVSRMCCTASLMISFPINKLETHIS